jgi:hypothetical protein
MEVVYGRHVLDVGKAQSDLRSILEIDHHVDLAGEEKVKLFFLSFFGRRREHG